MNRSSRRTTLIALVCFLLAIGSREVFRHLPPTIATPGWKLSWLLFCFAGLWIAHRTGPRAAVAELGLCASPARGLSIALLTTLPMAIVLLVMNRGAMHFVPQTMLSAVLIAATTEEILFRGYLFRQLHRRAGWPLLTAVLLTGLLFGLAHVGPVLRSGVMDVLGVTAITTLGGAFFAWLFVRWGDNLWVPIGVHLFMNAWWELFAVDRTALGGWGANLARALAIATVIGVTLRFTRRSSVRAAT